MIRDFVLGRVFSLLPGSPEQVGPLDEYNEGNFRGCNRSA